MGLRSRTADQPMPIDAPVRARRRPASREERIARQAMARHDAEREAFLEELRQTVRSGKYRVAGETIADALIEERLADRQQGE